MPFRIVPERRSFWLSAVGRKNRPGFMAVLNSFRFHEAPGKQGKGGIMKASCPDRP
ncbi:hypothetical protein HMPREF3038_01971 [Akkermansia sp. KLE1797]|nr:hypothetical protein HMPREF3038_01971 [Akkermansia sp. KLE1797]KXU54694.1 hypothetical protein HMPREF3039_01167 [Akkermansia sp. KLE1798]KZA06039.1 hypothetical protein HMPREF1326_00303 [Akkermansia sp. KLE1605]